jgi:hypothetical protein
MTRHGMWKRGLSVGLLLALAGGTSGRVTSWLAPPVAAQSSGGLIVVSSTAQEVTVNAPTGVANGNCTLGEAMLAANTTTAVDGCLLQGSAPFPIDLQQGQTYVLSKVQNWSYGPNALPVVAATMTIDGHGATLQVPSGTVRLRFFYVGANPAAPGTLGYHTPGAGSLTLRAVTLTGGRQHGGDSNGGGGGAGWAAPSSIMACCSSTGSRCATSGRPEATPRRLRITISSRAEEWDKSPSSNRSPDDRTNAAADLEDR